MSWENGWVWIIAALILAGVEVLLPVWVFLGIAIAVALVGLAILVGLAPASFPVALIVTAVLSGAVWLGLRRVMGVTHGQVKVWKTDINDNPPPRQK